MTVAGNYIDATSPILMAERYRQDNVQLTSGTVSHLLAGSPPQHVGVQDALCCLALADHLYVFTRCSNRYTVALQSMNGIGLPRTPGSFGRWVGDLIQISRALVYARFASPRNWWSYACTRLSELTALVYWDPLSTVSGLNVVSVMFSYGLRGY